MRPDEADEAQRQQALLGALAACDAAAIDAAGLHERGARAERGLAAYRANAQALAGRALAAAFPTVAAMLGDEAFALLARGFWRDAPPTRGDIGEWGAALPAWIEGEAGLAEWPWLADSARLDHALHVCERAGDDALDSASLALLGQVDPAGLWLDFGPGLALLTSAFPIVTIHAAHEAGDAAAFAAVREALGTGRGEAACVARQGWRARVHRLDPAETVFMRALLDGASLAAALDGAGAGLDFAAWLQRAIAADWLKEVRRGDDQGGRYTAAPPPRDAADPRR